jgi:hypothetical protein
MPLARTIALYCITALAEIVGCYLQSSRASARAPRHTKQERVIYRGTWLSRLADRGYPARQGARAARRADADEHDGRGDLRRPPNRGRHGMTVPPHERVDRG